MTIDEVCQSFHISRERLLSYERNGLLGDIHERQQSLDCLDYLIRKIKEDAAKR